MSAVIFPWEKSDLPELLRILNAHEPLVAALEKADKRVLRDSSVQDHACAECFPGGPPSDAPIIPGFRCAYHEAKARSALAAAKGTT